MKHRVVPIIGVRFLMVVLWNLCQELPGDVLKMRVLGLEFLGENDLA